jgi:hypothetical protein
VEVNNSADIFRFASGAGGSLGFQP